MTTTPAQELAHEPAKPAPADAYCRLSKTGAATLVWSRAGVHMEPGDVWERYVLATVQEGERIELLSAELRQVRDANARLKASNDDLAKRAQMSASMWQLEVEARHETEEAYRELKDDSDKSDEKILYWQRQGNDLRAQLSTANARVKELESLDASTIADLTELEKILCCELEARDDFFPSLTDAARELMGELEKATTRADLAEHRCKLFAEELASANEKLAFKEEVIKSAGERFESTCTMLQESKKSILVDLIACCTRATSAELLADDRLKRWGQFDDAVRAAIAANHGNNDQLTTLQLVEWVSKKATPAPTATPVTEQPVSKADELGELTPEREAWLRAKPAHYHVHELWPVLDKLRAELAYLRNMAKAYQATAEERGVELRSRSLVLMEAQRELSRIRAQALAWHRSGDWSRGLYAIKEGSKEMPLTTVPTWTSGLTTYEAFLVIEKGGAVADRAGIQHRWDGVGLVTRTSGAWSAQMKSDGVRMDYLPDFGPFTVVATNIGSDESEGLGGV